MPRGAQLEIEKIMRDFFWEGFDGDDTRHLAAWEVLCRPKSSGGLGIGCLADRNTSLLAKWLWRFPLEASSLWHKVIRARYGYSSNNWDPGPAPLATFRCPWKSIFSVADYFYPNTRWA